MPLLKPSTRPAATPAPARPPRPARPTPALPPADAPPPPPPGLIRARLCLAMLWGSLLGALLGLGWAVQIAGDAEQATLTAILLPDQEPESSARQAILEQVRRDGAVASARWLEPNQVRDELQREAGGLLDAGQFDTAPLPWLLELHVQPGSGALLAGLTGRVPTLTGWRLLWDGAAQGELESRQQAVWLALVAAAALVAVLGALALSGLPAAAAGVTQRGAAALLAGALAAGLLYLARRPAGAPPEALTLAAVAAILLAGVAAPMLRQPAPPPTEPPATPAHPATPAGPRPAPLANKIVGAAPDERPDPSDRSI